jgi:hypothetical protein
MGSEARATAFRRCAVSELADLARRVDRVESQLAIQQLAARYAVAVDSRDLDTWADLFVADVDSDHAKGTVYCRAEHEAGDRWIVMAICYFDTYERRDGRWYFLRRAEKHWYSSDVLERPGEPEFQNWPAWKDRKPTLPHQFPTWKRFWERTPAEELNKLSSQPWEPV